MEWAALTNVVPACGPCNASKCNGEVTSWLRRKGLAEREFLLRHAEIRRTLGPQVATSVPEAAADLLS